MTAITQKQSPGSKWTPAQLQAIHTTGCSLLVSAAAGSGKTSVLAERCVHLLCDGEAGCEVGDLLVVTFTEAAAAEMKARIGRSLAQRHAIAPGEITARHLAMLDRAHIGTLHGFCARVLRQNFQMLGLDPSFRILDADEAALLKLDTARDLFGQWYDDPEADDFRRMVDCYADGNDDRLVQQVINAYDTLCSVVDPVDWLHKARRRIEEAIDQPFEKSELGEIYIKAIHGGLTSVLQECHTTAIALKQLNHFDKYVQHLRVLYAMLKDWLTTLESAGIDALVQKVSAGDLPPIPRKSGDVEGQDAAKKRVDSIRDAMKKGDWKKNLLFTTDEWKEGLRQTLPHVEVFLALVADFSARYSTAKDEQVSLDFADLEQLALRSLKIDGVKPSVPSALARGYHQQFKHVLVDEYQDNNQVQDEILSLVSRECLAGKSGLPPNLFCVGDVKQSIYRFRLAEVKQFLDRREKYSLPGSIGQVVDLQMNFRSRKPLLDAINGVFERLMTEETADLNYDESQKLIAGQTFPDNPSGFHGSPIELHLIPADAPGASDSDAEEEDLDRTEREAALLGHRILELTGHRDQPAMQVVDRSGAEPVSRPIRFGDIVLLLRTMKHKADQFAATLRNMGVPVHAESATGYFEATEVNDILSLLHVLDNQRQDIPLAALLRSPLANLKNAEDHLATITLAYRGEPFHVAVQKYADEQTDDLADFLRKFREKLQNRRQEIRQRPVAEVLWRIYDQTGYLAFVAGLPNGEQRQANLIELHDRARQFATFNRQGLGRFLIFLEKLKQETDLGQASIASEADDVVRIMSIHRSKGQEFPVVLLPDLGKRFNMQDCQGSILLDRAAGLGLQVIDDVLQVKYPSLASTVVQQRLRQQTLAEEMRVLYVAMTRAKEHLILAGTCAADRPEVWREQWANHDGPLPAEMVLAAKTFLDWIGPAAAILPGQIEIQMHTGEEVAAWAVDQAGPIEMTQEQTAMTNRRTLSPAPAASTEADAVIARMNFSYPHQAFADLAATASVTHLVKNNAPVSHVALPSKSLDRTLSQPAFVAGALPLDAAARGTATHAVLEHFDFAKAGEIEGQIAHLVATKRLKQHEAEAVDRSAIGWFLNSEIGQLIQRQAKSLHRELPVYYANPSEATDPMDQQMVRGRIDLLVPTHAGWMIVDYKTDRVEGAALEERAALYAGQLEIYRKAISKITGKTVVEAAIVFLSAREIRIV